MGGFAAVRRMEVTTLDSGGEKLRQWDRHFDQITDARVVPTPRKGKIFPKKDFLNKKFWIPHFIFEKNQPFGVQRRNVL